MIRLKASSGENKKPLNCGYQKKNIAENRSGSVHEQPNNPKKALLVHKVTQAQLQDRQSETIRKI